MLRVLDIMTPHVVTLSPEVPLRAAIDTLVACRIGGAPVLDGGKMVGVLSAPDILEFESVTPMGDHTVGEAMSRSVCTVPEGLEISSAAERMLAAGAQRALVTRGGMIAGILTTTDILRAVAEQRLNVPQFLFS